jgi:hypothetical protein
VRHRLELLAVVSLLIAGLLALPAVAAAADTTAAPIEADAAATGLGAAAGGYAISESLGLFDPLTATWYLRDTVGRTTHFGFGEADTIPLMGDWDGDGFDTPGYYRPWDGFAGLRDTNSAGRLNGVRFLAAGGIPVAADCNGDGVDAISLVVNDRLLVGDLPADTVPAKVPAGVTAAAAVDRDGDGRDEILVRAAGSWWLEGRRVTGPALTPDARAVTGDFNGDGAASMAVFRPANAEFWVYAGDEPASGVTIMPFGSSRMLPVAGRFGVPEGEPGTPPRMLDIPPLTQGVTSPDVARLQAELTARALYRGPIDGTFGSETAYAVMALHKAAGAERTWDWERGDTDLLALFEPGGFPYREDEPDRIEVDITRQVLFFIEDQQVAAIVPVSSGGGYTYYSKRAEANVAARTPRGDFELLRYSNGWSCDPLYGWCIYKPWNFTNFYAIHGYNSVPAYPASHGCVRIPNWDADILEDQWYVGLPVHVWDVPPEDLPIVGE